MVKKIEVIVSCDFNLKYDNNFKLYISESKRRMMWMMRIVFDYVFCLILK